MSRKTKEDSGSIEAANQALSSALKELALQTIAAGEALAAPKKFGKPLPDDGMDIFAELNESCEEMILAYEQYTDMMDRLNQSESWEPGDD